MTVFPVLPHASTYVYVKVYDHTVFVSTLPEMITFAPLPSTLSVRLAQVSVYTPPCAIVIMPLPCNVTTGAVWSVTRTVLVTVFDMLPAPSVYVYVNVYTPTVHVSTCPLVAGLIVPGASILSVQSAPSST